MLLTGLAAAFGVGFVVAVCRSKPKTQGRVRRDLETAPVFTMPTPFPEVKPFRVWRAAPEEWVVQGYGQYTSRETFTNWDDAIEFVNGRLRSRAALKAAAG